VTQIKPNFIVIPPVLLVAILSLPLHCFGTTLYQPGGENYDVQIQVDQSDTGPVILQTGSEASSGLSNCSVASDCSVINPDVAQADYGNADVDSSLTAPQIIQFAFRARNQIAGPGDDTEDSEISGMPMNWMVFAAALVLSAGVGWVAFRKPQLRRSLARLIFR
jgi:hypothetical protein